MADDESTTHAETDHEAPKATTVTFHGNAELHPETALHCAASVASALKHLLGRGPLEPGELDVALGLATVAEHLTQSLAVRL